MDMKKILQALDGAASKPVEGVSSMARFLRVVKEGDLNQPAALPAAPKFYITQTSYNSLGEPPDFSVTDLQRGIVVASFDSEKEARTYVAQKDPAGAPQTELHQMQSKASAPEANPDAAPQAQPSVAEEVGMSRFISIISEGKGPLNRPTAAESIAMQHYAEPAKKSITTPTLNIAAGAKPSMIGKYFKTVSEEFNANADQSKTRARQLAERVIERIVPGQEPAPGINRLTGKPNVPDAMTPEPAIPAAPVQPLSSRYGPGYEGSPEAYTITIKGQNYKFAGRDKQGPGTGEIVKVPGGAVGIRGLAPVSVELGTDGLFYTAPKTESVSEDLNPPDAVTVDIPLLIRLLEYAKEELENDVDLHTVAEKLIQMSGNGETLTMDDYDAIVGDQLALPAPDENNDGKEDY